MFDKKTFVQPRKITGFNSRGAKGLLRFRQILGVTLVLFSPAVTINDSAMAGTTIPQTRPGEPIPGLSPLELSRFFAGKTLYITPLQASQGLGPAFNKASCGNCHNAPTGGPGSQDVVRFGKITNGEFDPLAELGGSLLQESAIGEECFEVVPAEATIVVNRVTNGALAYGLVESIPDQSIVDNRNAQPAAQQGTIHWVGAFEDPPGSDLRVGRFGWKAQVPTVLTFSADASLNEMGLTNDFVGDENAPNGNEAQLAMCDAVTDPEDQPDNEGFHFIERITHFQRFLAPFPQTPKSGMTGETIFNTIGCAVCHTPSFTTPDDPKLESALRNKPVRAYTDWLLHYMGQSGDPIVQGAGGDGMIKTAPLWGLGHGLNGEGKDPMWHDGRLASDTFENRVRAAIALHNPPVTKQYGVSQGAEAEIAFNALSVSDQNKLIAFLRSLGQIEFDIDYDNDVQSDDFTFGFKSCYTGPGSFYTPDDPCAIHDIDQDGDVDLDDFDGFLLAYVGPRRDCNSNGEVDLKDILLGAPDVDFNAIPDSCEPTCDADINGNGTVNVADLLGVIQQWGACPPLTEPCAADIDYNNVVNVQDLLGVILAWGNCF